MRVAVHLRLCMADVPGATGPRRGALEAARRAVTSQTSVHFLHALIIEAVRCACDVVLRLGAAGYVV